MFSIFSLTFVYHIGFIRMESSTLSLTQSISQISAPPTLSVEDDFMQTPHKTISELLEATDVGILYIKLFLMIK